LKKAGFGFQKIAKKTGFGFGKTQVRNPQYIHMLQSSSDRTGFEFHGL